jgi:hypothetical protein
MISVEHTSVKIIVFFYNLISNIPVTRPLIDSTRKQQSILAYFKVQYKHCRLEMTKEPHSRKQLPGTKPRPLKCEA